MFVKVSVSKSRKRQWYQLKDMSGQSIMIIMFARTKLILAKQNT